MTFQSSEFSCISGHKVTNHNWDQEAANHLLTRFTADTYRLSIAIL